MITDALNIEDIVKDYNSKNVINNISMSINPGEIIGLLGPNGAGKTTLFYIIMGLIRPNSGQIKLDGHDITKLAMYSRARLGISYLPQEPSIFRGMNVRDNINCVLEITEKNKKLRKIKLEKLIEIFGLEKIQKSSARVLSGGERRRVEIARSIATQPKYILMDEPFSGVDPIAIEEIKKIIKSLSDNNIGIIITDHNVRDTLSLIDRAYLIYEGRILISGSSDEILNSDDAKRVYLGNDFNI
ncbi:MAG: LPS export ABC transporter ATP-binding protein [Hyphomicrobiales bacterium]|jgi:lipopolysaccharide export system ATP-binding protein|nr:LPS export ABC transporter ATP-binding protein [Alphaproteobacteria bacterium]